MINSHAIASMGTRRGQEQAVAPPPPRKYKKIFLGYIGGLFATFFSFWRPFHHVGAFSLLFTSWWRPFLGLPPPTKISAAPMIARGVREHAPRKFFCVTAI